MSDVSAAFEATNKSISRANAAILEFDFSVAAYFKSGVAELVVDLDDQSGEYVPKLRLREPLPKIVERRAIEGLLTIKHAFDQAAFAAHILTGGQRRDHIYFPWADSPSDLEGRLRRFGFHQGLWEVFVSHQPYPGSDRHPGGDDVLRELARLANNKHTVGVSAIPDLMRGRLGEFYPGGSQSFTLMQPRWDPVKNEAEIARWTGKMEVGGKHKFTFQVFFKDTILAQSVPVGSSLRRFAAKAKAVAESLEARCHDLGPASVER